MAKSVDNFTWARGFREPTDDLTWEAHAGADDVGYICPPSKEVVTSLTHNKLGINVLRTWPTIYDGTNSPYGIPKWWKPQSEVDVLICGAGPGGLEVALSLVRQGVSFRIIDKADTPLTAGRADAVLPRYLEVLASWGLAKEIHEEGPLINHTAIYKDGQKLLFNRSFQSDSRYRGGHVITQGQIERIFVRDLLRHHVLVERSTLLSDFSVEESGGLYPVSATLRNTTTGMEEHIRAKFLVGSDGAASTVRKKLGIPFDGTSTNMYWGIMDCIFESDYPHAWVFGLILSSKHGGCCIIPREDGYIRLYVQLDVAQFDSIAASRQDKDPSSAEAGVRVDANSITAEEVLEQANRIFAPYTIKFAAPLSWFAVWKVSERVARTFSSPDQRVHLVGDAAHVHSAMGAFGLNASMMDAANLAWKMGLVARNKAQFDVLMPTYSYERRIHAIRAIEVSGEYFRFVCNIDLPLTKFHGVEPNQSTNPAHGDKNSTEASHCNGKDQTTANGIEKDLQFLGNFFRRNWAFLLGLEIPYHPSVVSPHPKASTEKDIFRPIKVPNGLRAPNPRVCFSTNETGYLYEKMTGASTFHLLLFVSTMHHAVRQQLTQFAAAFESTGFYHRFGGREMFNIVLVANCLPFELEELTVGSELELLRSKATLVFDDRAPDENAHTTWGVDHRTGGLAVVRPDLLVGFAAVPGDIEGLGQYFSSFLKIDNGLNA